MASPPHFDAADARPLNGKIAVSVKNPVTEFGVTWTISNRVARELAASILASVEANESQTAAEKLSAEPRGG
ncbi:MAG TPA: hypothetical protein VGH28_14040 [Polyangiaceae bacterium]|jgi:hypothetical protein